MPRRKTHEEFVAKLKSTHPNLILLDTYTNNHTPIRCRCAICGSIRCSQPKDIIKGCGCVECYNKIRVKPRSQTHDEFIRKLSIVNPDIEVLGQYTNSISRIMVRCQGCGRVWSPKANDLSNGHGCPRCAKRAPRNEKIIRDYLNDKNIPFISQMKFDDLHGLTGRLYAYDFYLPDYKMLIEYQGEFHVGVPDLQTDDELHKQQERDAQKRDYASQNGYHLLEIWFYDERDIPSIIDDYLKTTITTKAS